MFESNRIIAKQSFFKILYPVLKWICVVVCFLEKQLIKLVQKDTEVSFFSVVFLDAL